MKYQCESCLKTFDRREDAIMHGIHSWTRILTVPESKEDIKLLELAEVDHADYFIGGRPK